MPILYQIKTIVQKYYCKYISKKSKIFYELKKHNKTLPANTTKLGGFLSQGIIVISLKTSSIGFATTTNSISSILPLGTNVQ
jgi:hypothetical protein